MRASAGCHRRALTRRRRCADVLQLFSVDPDNDPEGWLENANVAY
jgi:hypothetical protein